MFVLVDTSFCFS